MHEMRRLGIIPIIDLLHFGLPDWLGNFQNPEWPLRFADYAHAFAERYPWVRYYTPVNEIYVTALFSASYGWWNERMMSDAAFVNNVKHSVKASILAMRAILDLRPDAIFIFSESTEYVHPGSPDMVPHALFTNERRFLSLDLLFGHDVSATMFRYLLNAGMTAEEYVWFRDQRDLRSHCIMGTDYYITNEHVVRSDGTTIGAGDVYGYYVITRQYYDRYRLPVMHTETNRGRPRGRRVAVEGVDEPPAAPRGRRPRRRLHLVRPGRHEGLGHGPHPASGATSTPSACTPSTASPGRSPSRVQAARRGVRPARRSAPASSPS